MNLLEQAEKAVENGEYDKAKQLLNKYEEAGKIISEGNFQDECLPGYLSKEEEEADRRGTLL